MEDKKVNFEEVTEELLKLSTKAQVTFINRLIGHFGPNMCRSTIRYCCMRLDSINSKFPPGHPNRVRYELYAEKHRKS